MNYLVEHGAYNDKLINDENKIIFFFFNESNFDSNINKYVEEHDIIRY